ncbi:MAG: hypothetical protein JWM41_4875 [Gemmatimonadetes bacterium]|nr:hypothetical protein [Gemmatimonadota bacterium]
MRSPYSAAAIAALLLAHPAVSMAQRPHVIQGRVTTDSGAVVAAADVIVTVAPSAETIAGKSDAAGAYRIVIPNATGEYILYIGALGRKPFRQRVTIAKTDSVATVNAELAAAVTTVAAVQVNARKIRPTRSLGNEPGWGTDGTDKSVDGMSGALPPDLQGNLDAMAAFIPGLSVGMGTSAFGLGPDANSTTLNGLAFGGSDLPRDARTNTRFRTSPWDPTIGGFTGVQTAVSMAPGSNITRRSGHVTFDAPALQFSDPVASRLGQKFMNLALDEGGTGAYKLDKYYYNFGIHAARQTASVASLAELDPEALARAGIAPDSAARLAQVLGTMHVPLGGRGIPDSRRTTTLSFIDRVDRAQSPRPPSAAPAPILAATLFGRVAQSEALSLAPTIEPSSAGKSIGTLAGVQGLYSRFFGHDGDYVSETTSGLSLATTHGTPYLELPGGSVLVASASGLGSLGFGGNSALANDMRTWTWETINQTDFLANGHASLPMKIYFQSRFDDFSQSLSANRLGRFNFASLQDLAANRPSSFSRTLNAPDRSGGEWIGAAAFGGTWTTTPVTITGGVRADANAFTGGPRYNADVDRTFGVRNDHAPNSMDFSPRVGITWRYTQPMMNDLRNGPSIMVSPMSIIFRNAAAIRAGFGKFRGVLPVTLLADATSNTGLAGAMQQLLCVGSASPIPDWTTYSADPSTVPSTCSGGASTFADTARSVSLFDKSFRAPESWRANVGWTGVDFLKMFLSVDASYSLNRNQASTVDLNFSGVQRFTLSAEGNRPVFVSAGSIVPSTGSISALESRTTGAYGRVSDRRSDLRSTAKQLSVYMIPGNPFNWGQATFSYTYVDARTQARGFDGSTAADPRAIEWAPSSFAPRHQFTMQISRMLPGSVGLSGGLRTSSGFTFSPTVAGDVNGDGSSNDRAFIFNPAAVRDPVLAAGLNELLTTGSPAARDCLRRQLGAVAGRNSCVGPWFTTMNANVAFLKIPHSHDARAYIAFANLPGALDQLLHGGDGLRGWGLLPLPDQTLYQVKGFNPTTREFSYQVNPRFGASSPATTTRRNPFRITLDVQLSLGRSVQEQQVEQNVRVRPSLVGTRAPADTIKARYLRSGFTDIYGAMLRLADSLALSRDQVEAIRAQQPKLRARADSVFTGLGAYLAALPDNFSVATAVKRVTDTNDAMWEIIYGEVPFLVKTLTPGQRRILPFGLREMVANPERKGIRFSYGGGS